MSEQHPKEPFRFRVDSAADRDFRMEVRDWLAASLPDHLRNHIHRLPRPLLEPWHRTLYARGWIAPHWPKEFGGMGASIDRQIIFGEEYARAQAPVIVSPGLNFIGPLLMERGTPAQQQEHLPKILSGDRFFAQGYSEPGAGSDLASLRTRAELKGDRFVVNGHKIWTSWAQYCDWIFALVRTDPQAPKHRGISFLLIDLATPGITIRPIRSIANDPEFCEVFFDNVEAPAANLIGPINEGWSVANSLLVHERLTGGNPIEVIAGLERAKQVGAATGAMENAAFRDRLAGLEIDGLSLTAAYGHVVELHKSGRKLGPETSALKIFKGATLQALTDMMIEAAGGGAPCRDRLPTAGGALELAELWLQSRRTTIFGGAQEVQYNIVSKRVLSLP